MDNKNSYSAADERIEELKIFSSHGASPEFVPWRRGEKGVQKYLKMSKGDEIALFYEGENAVIQPELQRGLMQLASDGWKNEGEISVSFDGIQGERNGRLLSRSQMTVEIGAALLPLVDPEFGSPLLSKLDAVREDLARTLGFIIPGINVMDNMMLPPNAYVIKIRESSVASFELFLDRMLALGPQEEIQNLQGWSVIEPTFRIPAKWIEPSQREAAEAAGCMVQGALNVILTHISDVISKNSFKILGLQEAYELIAELSETHPAVVKEFLDDMPSVRAIRKVLCSLLEEDVPISDLVTIMETVGEHASELSEPLRMAEYVRMELASQICERAASSDGFIKSVMFDDTLENELKSMITDAIGGAYLKIDSQQCEKLSKLIRESLPEESEALPVIIAAPEIRRHIRDFAVSEGISVRVLSSREIAPGAKVVCGERIKGSLIPPEKQADAKKKKDSGVFWSRKINQPDKKDK